MARSLVIVESPAKARTIEGILGDDFVVESSIGHIRDLPAKGLGVDVDHGFAPTYEVHANKRDVIRRLKALLKDVDELYLATDEDREGEAISWHLLEELKPRVPVKRMVFHEITRGAIERAVDEWRDIDMGLVNAQESRRIVDRLFGYPVSSVLWRKVNQGLSAGRVQSPAVRLVVERERERMAFVSADYWDLSAAFATDPAFTSGIVAVEGKRVAQGRDFDSEGRSKESVVVLDQARAEAVRDGLDGATFTVTSVEEKPFTSRPKPPFMTSTLQQEGGRKLRMTAAGVMRVAQELYQGGYITYMRTDSINLSETAITAARSQIRAMYGNDYLPDAPRTYSRKVKNAQEAHEAIRPAGETFRTPDSLRGELRGDALALYDLVWKRTIACQMADARGRSLSVRLEAPATEAGRAEPTTTEWSASGRTITFPGYMRAYVEGADDPDAQLDDRESLLPALTEGQTLTPTEVEALGHTTSPPARYTEASLVKRLEELGIGRPSTYASIMQVIQDRGYVWKKGTALVPSWTAFAVIKLLEEHFTDLVDYAYTARMEDELDQIAAASLEREPWLHQFWFGDGGDGPATGNGDGGDEGRIGLERLVDEGLSKIDAAAINSIPIGVDADGEPIVVKPGRYGPYVKRGDETASVPDDIAPDELDVAKAIELLSAPKGDVALGTDPETGLAVYAKPGRYGPYVQLGEIEDGAKTKPKTSSLLQTMTLDTITLDDALKLLSLPRTVGVDPESGEEITAQNGRYGPYLKKGTDSRSLETEEQMFTVDLDAALRIFAQPKRGRGQAAPAAPLRELEGKDPVSGQPVVVKDGRFGPYVTDGETNASLRKGDTVENMTIDRAAELLQIRREAGPSKKKKATKKKAAKKKAPAKKKAATKKAATKKAATKKAAAKKKAPAETSEG
ncbi:type I DNA topoisomerase [Iamia sp. SCSIO 61187]|uniref:type I DNA topoisomerase n=1 Tax=Iamia sp. SCSIO 61187 TaxID=2722752 RepID=UPI001C633A62|nr:type I DNA topoisomerase [Iamia sp. SCSIO 61187]QYG94658.1 type I DNA topoisomerase [Iamia sp. SCSIO 61187]